MESKHSRMTTEPVEKLVVRLAAPSIVIMLISAMYNMADTYFVSTIGTAAVAAVGVGFAVMALIQAIGFLFGHGAGNYISRELGAKHNVLADKMAATGLITAVLTCSVLAAIGLLNLERLAVFLGSTPTILPYACDYLQYIILGMPWMAASLTLNNLLRFQGSAFFGMIGMTSGAVLNIILDPILIFGFDMGVAGAGLATMISQLVSCLLLLAGCTKGENIRIRLSNFAPGLGIYTEILRGGFPSLCRQGLMSVSTIYLNNKAGIFGDPAIAAMSIVQRVSMFAGSALIGFGQGFQPVCGFNYGAQLYGRVRKAFWFCTKVSTVVLLALAVLGYIYAHEIIAFFRGEDRDVMEIGVLALRLQCFTFPLMGLTILTSMMTQTIGLAFKASILAAARRGLFMIPLLYILTPVYGLFGVQLSQPASDLATVVLTIPICLSVLRNMGKSKESVRETMTYPTDE
jgi:putative efflux protein, MATE family